MLFHLKTRVHKSDHRPRGFTANPKQKVLFTAKKQERESFGKTFTTASNKHYPITGLKIYFSNHNQNLVHKRQKTNQKKKPHICWSQSKNQNYNSKVIG